ncbi:ABC-type transport auxiliary lipoprotein family protein [Sulfuricurvum sp.]|uniref:ABC-type transport auxiliary lipoprotein family protein n=1 Tax=Sulfuricurvum sp. TaxID=2025608 RepID=UPI002623CAA1|nr:ABC-type transport auxiliary lipoprotein family protein [Sulfuricurvum sp.]MDD2266507.1 ABC-type transport auxiliary lipoprotein family protein [Sulfuricurvum sp.]MDD2783981.1 ABC-type transport auxiliary lipoprotein family protein [Sulfuricurvum sp.]
MRYPFFFLLSSLLIIGCSAPLTPPINEYTILPYEHSVKETAPLSSHTLSIASSKTLPSLASKNLYYLREGGESGAYLYSRWSDTPSVLIQQILTASLEEKGLFASLLPPTSSAHADWVLESDLNAFYHRFSSKDKSEGFIDITYRLIDTTTKLPIGSKRFTVTVPATTNDAKGGVTALTQATRQLSTEVMEWMRNLIQEKR